MKFTLPIDQARLAFSFACVVFAIVFSFDGSGLRRRSK